MRSATIELCAHGHPASDLVEGREIFWQVDPADCLVLRDAAATDSIAEEPRHPATPEETS